jgi:hypothetical protein
MQASRTIRPETIGLVATDLIGLVLGPADLAATAVLLNALAADMAPLATFSPGDDEPVLVYDPARGEP